MSVQWLAVQSFQHSQDILSAINTLSIHLKLESAGIKDEARAQQAAAARGKLVTFLAELEPMVSEAENDEAKPVVGADPRLRQLAKSFVSAKRNRFRFHSALFRNTIGQAKQLLDSQRPEDREPLLECLEELRLLIEEHVHTDTERVLGEF
jgi:hypothetical protein